MPKSAISFSDNILIIKHIESDRRLTIWLKFLSVRFRTFSIGTPLSKLDF
jgi:hypothetical protein